MKYFYLKAIAALLVCLTALAVGIRLVYPDPGEVKNEKSVQRLMDKLAEGNVLISSELIDLSEYTVFEQKVFEQNMKSASDERNTVWRFIGKDAVKNADGEYSSDKGKVSFSGAHISYIPNEGRFSQYTSSVTIANAVDAAKKICGDCGINIKEARMEVSGGKNGISVSVISLLKNLPVFNNAFVMEMDTDGLHSLSGVDFRPDGAVSAERRALGMDEALIKFMRECTEKSRETIITDARLGYMLDNTDTGDTFVKPVWRIIVENSAVYYIDA